MTIKQLRTGKWSGIVQTTLNGMSDDEAVEYFGKCENAFELQNACWAYLGLGYRRTKKTYGLSLDPDVYTFWSNRAGELGMGTSTLINKVLKENMG